MAFLIEKLIKDYTLESAYKKHRFSAPPCSYSRDTKINRNNSSIARIVLWNKIWRDKCYPLSHI